MIDHYQVNDLAAKARDAIGINNKTDADWDRAFRAVDQVIKVSSDPTGLAPEVIDDLAELHAELTNMSCDCPLCLAVTS